MGDISFAIKVDSWQQIAFYLKLELTQGEITFDTYEWLKRALDSLNPQVFVT